MIITQTLKIKCSSRNIKKLKEINKEIKIGDEILINIKDLSLGSNKKIKVKCDNCGLEKEISYYDYNKITDNQTSNYFCKKCKNIKTKQTNLERYGVENIFQNEQVKEKIKQTNLKKYGTEHHLKNKEILKKQQETNLKKYGVKYQTQRKEVVEKQKSTNLKKYGNEFSLKNKDIKEKAKKTLLEKYNVLNPMQNDKIKTKAQNKKKEKIINKYKDYNILNIDKNIYTVECEKGHNFEITSELFRNRIKQKTIICTECNPVNSYSISGLEKELQDFIFENEKNVELNKRNIISPHELDIYLSDYNLALEFNGVYWHNELNKSNDYHINKTNKCDNKNIQLLHIWEDDWVYKKEIVKSIILNKLNKTKNKIYGRKCEIKEITNNKLIKEFLNENHIQGFVQSKIKIGLFFDNELISIMTFGMSRKPLGV